MATVNSQFGLIGVTEQGRGGIERLEARAVARGVMEDVRDACGIVAAKGTHA